MPDNLLFQINPVDTALGPPSTAQFMALWQFHDSFQNPSGIFAGFPGGYIVRIAGD